MAEARGLRSHEVKKAEPSRSERVFRRDARGPTLDRDLNAARSLAALTELAAVGLTVQMVTGQPVDWSKLPIRPDGWGQTRTSAVRGGVPRAARPKEGEEDRPARFCRGPPL